MIDGEQYVTVVAGSRIQHGPVKGLESIGRVFTFSLDGKLKMPPVGRDPRLRGPIPEPFGMQAQIGQGFELYFRHCMIPDLRYAPEGVHSAWDAIVLKGAYSSKGMPAFGDILSSADAEAIRAFVVMRAQTRDEEG